jgi:hypothetical protein
MYNNSLIQPQLKVKVTLRLAVYRQSVRLGVKPLETPCYSLCTDHIENISSIIECSLVAGETTCPQSCSLETAAV